MAPMTIPAIAPAGRPDLGAELPPIAAGVAEEVGEDDENMELDRVDEEAVDVKEVSS